MNIYSSVIYKATNKINGKSYIGFTIDFQRRKIEHLKTSLNKNSPYYKDYFYSALRKYSSQNFDWEILYFSNNPEICLNLMEPYFIKNHKH